jgi:hypothetical protein
MHTPRSKVVTTYFCETQEVLPDCYLTHRSPRYEVEKTVMSGTEGLFELECKKDLFGVMARY